MTELYGIIYKVTNKINSKVYIGQTVQSLNKRISQHINSSLNVLDNVYFHNAIRKYGKENFEWLVVAKCSSKKELNSIEIKMIEECNSFNKGYNLALGGISNTGYKYTEEQKRKNSEIRKGKKRTEEIKKKISEAQKGEKGFWYGKHLTEKTKNKISKATMGNKNPKAKKYIITTPEGKEIFVHGIVDFCRNYKEEKLHHQNLIKVAQGKYNYYKKYKCKYYMGT